MTEASLSGPEFTGETALVAAPLEVKIAFGLSLASGILTVIGGILVLLVTASIPLIVGLENAEAANALTPSGGNQPHDNMSPYQVVNFIISMYGIYPSPT